MQFARHLRRVALVVLAAGASVASAHPGHPDAAMGFGAGFVHPLGGADHLLAMVAVGLWAAAALPPRRRWIAPLLFVAALTAGAALAHGGWLPAPGGSLELLIAASVVLLGAMLVGIDRVHAAAGLALTGAAGLLHGTAHGLEMAGGLSFVAYAAGFASASALLHCAGLGAAQALMRLRVGALRLAGAAVGTWGALLLVARL
ncbi:MAG: HupE/UreJ family protein [Proteobacteria bacterium]|jgi:urease accessory protein|nr:HupE/UreJ family protein [Pseudomonadota bacterium]HOL36768.1 HupE/UreJ family protein [Rubrivivax sp.]